MSYQVKTRASNGVKFVEFIGHDGKRKRVSLGTKDGERAKGRAREIYMMHIGSRSKTRTSIQKDVSRYTLNMAIDRAERTVWARDRVRSDLAYKSLQSDLRQLRKEFGDEAVSSIDTERLLRYVEKCRERGLGYGTIDKHFGRLSKVLNLCASEIKDPATSRFVIAYVPKFPALGAAVRRDVVVSPEEEQRLIDACRSLGEQKRKAADYRMIEAFITWQIDTGMRLGETLAMVADWLVSDDDGSAVVIPAEVTKTGQSRVAVLMGRAEGTAGWLTSVSPQMFGSTLSRGKVQDMWTQVREKAGLPDIHIHDLRHTAATRWRDEGIPLDTVGRMLGHTDVKMTYQVYDQVNLPRLRKELRSAQVVPFPGAKVA
ncbi:site-specific integrase [Altererythrobacter fulvus]|uniref:tyrosine-type recombinase/integrase n=1 Tax=Caenibius fulvus TaxID=2126012 RepID=UPI00301B28E3